MKEKKLSNILTIVIFNFICRKFIAGDWSSADAISRPNVRTPSCNESPRISTASIVHAIKWLLLRPNTSKQCNFISLFRRKWYQNNRNWWSKLVQKYCKKFSEKSLLWLKAQTVICGKSLKFEAFFLEMQWRYNRRSILYKRISTISIVFLWFLHICRSLAVLSHRSSL